MCSPIKTKYKQTNKQIHHTVLLIGDRILIHYFYFLGDHILIGGRGLIKDKLNNNQLNNFQKSEGEITGLEWPGKSSMEKGRHVWNLGWGTGFGQLEKVVQESWGQCSPEPVITCSR